MRFLLGILFLMCIGFALQEISEKPLLYKFTTSGIDLEIQKFFYGEESKFYVDIGTQHPIHESVTVHLRKQRWTGLNINSDPGLLKKFFLQRKGDLNLNLFVGESQKLIEIKKKQNQKSNKIHSLSLGQVCKQSYLQAPKFLNINVPGSQKLILESNNWKQNICQPHLISIKVKNQSKQIQLILQKLGYKQLIGYSQFQNYVFVKNDKYNYYIENYKKGQKYLNKINYIYFQQINKQIRQYLGIRNINSQYDSLKDNYYFYFVKKDEIIDLLSVCVQSQEAFKEDRPIFILNFNDNKLILPKQSSISKKEIKNKIYSHIQIKNEYNDCNLYILQGLNPQIKKIQSLKILNREGGSDFHITKKQEYLGLQSLQKLMILNLILISISCLSYFITQKKKTRDVYENISNVTTTESNLSELKNM